jgi:broad specificity phosphatase PhoE
MKIYLVRHGQTLFNAKGRVQGWCDSPLTKEGIQQAIAVSKSLQSIPFEYGYSSTSERAMDTLSYIIGQRDIPYTYLKGLKEMNFGSLEGDKEEEVFTDMSIYQKGFVEFGGETLQSSNKRFMDTLEDIAKKHDDNVLVVAHGGVIMGALMILDEELVQIHLNTKGFIGNCSVTILEYENNEFKILKLADTSFRDRGLEL